MRQLSASQIKELYNKGERNFSGIIALGQDFTDFNLKNIVFKNSKLNGSSFANANLENADFSNASLQWTSFYNSNSRKFLEI